MTYATASGGRTPRGQAEHQVLAAVTALLDEGEAFTTLSVGRIADRAGVARSSFYFHFPDKRTLLQRLAASVTATLFEPAEAWVEDPGHDLEGLTAVLEQTVAAYRRHGPLLAAITEVAAYDPEFAVYWRALVGELIGKVRLRLERDRRAGLLPRDLEAAGVAEHLVWGAEQALAQHVATGRGGLGDRRLAVGIAQSMWAVMAPRG